MAARKICGARRYGDDVSLSVLAMVALVAIVLWADILGHGLGFEKSALAVRQIGNSRLFFLAGFTAAAVVSIALARRAEKSDTALPSYVALAVSVAGALLYACARVQAALPSGMLAVAGLSCCGAGYYATTLLLYCGLAKARRLPSAIVAIAAALFLKTVLGSWLSVSAPFAVQLTLACVLPFVSFRCIAAMRRFDPCDLEEYRSRSSLSNAGVSDLLFLLVAVSLILAVLRGMSHLGLWGEGYAGSPVSTIAGYATVGFALFAFTYFTLVRNSNNHMLVRFQPAFLVLAAGFVLYILQDGFLEEARVLPLFDWLYLTVELFGHLLSGTLILTAIRASRMAPWAFQGVSDASFGLVAIPWVFLAQDPSVDVKPFMVIAIFLVMVAAIRPMSTRPFEIEHSLDAGSGLAGWPASSSCVAAGASAAACESGGASQSGNGGESVVSQGSEIPLAEEGTCGSRQARASAKEGFSVERRLAEYHREIARIHGLSVRETDVFMLLAQGRSRPYICEALYLSDGTVKTHVSHIYRKFDVHSRQELLDAVQGEIVRMDERMLG